jgi:hypothetical protein
MTSPNDNDKNKDTTSDPKASGGEQKADKHAAAKETLNKIINKTGVLVGKVFAVIKAATKDVVQELHNVNNIRKETVATAAEGTKKTDLAKTFWAKTSGKQRGIVLGLVITIIIILNSVMSPSNEKNLNVKQPTPKQPLQSDSNSNQSLNLMSKAFNPIGTNNASLSAEWQDKGGLNSINNENNWFGIQLETISARKYSDTGSIASLEIKTLASGSEIRSALARACGTTPDSFVRGTIGDKATPNGTWNGVRKSDNKYMKCYYEAPGNGQGYIIVLTRTTEPYK